MFEPPEETQQQTQSTPRLSINTEASTTLLSDEVMKRRHLSNISLVLKSAKSTSENSRSSTTSSRRYSAAESITTPEVYSRKPSEVSILFTTYQTPRDNKSLESLVRSVSDDMIEEEAGYMSIGALDRSRKRSIADVASYVSRRGSNVANSSPAKSRLETHNLRMKSNWSSSQNSTPQGSPALTRAHSRRRSRAASPLRPEGAESLEDSLSSLSIHDLNLTDEIFSPSVYNSNNVFPLEKGSFDVHHTLIKQLIHMKERADIGILYILGAKPANDAAVNSSEVLHSAVEKEEITERLFQTPISKQLKNQMHSSSWPPSIFGLL